MNGFSSLIQKHLIAKSKQKQQFLVSSSNSSKKEGDETSDLLHNSANRKSAIVIKNNQPADRIKPFEDQLDYTDGPSGQNNASPYTDNLDNILDLTNPRPQKNPKAAANPTKFQQPEDINISGDEYEEEEEEEEPDDLEQLRPKPKTGNKQPKKMIPNPNDIEKPIMRGNKSLKNEKEVRLMDSEIRPKKSIKKSNSGTGVPSADTNVRSNNPNLKKTSNLPMIQEVRRDPPKPKGSIPFTESETARSNMNKGSGTGLV
ncbi:unnamed protein product [Moneuplotes crassus]|uniref:Uncharacterized protein n=1 Tax=Euplotes crassus TaxID=5936 RepID=A0AAD1UFA8_EUPCR|nr:unnamed protein product [Moneuplotes crassus]